MWDFCIYYGMIRYALLRQTIEHALGNLLDRYGETIK